MHAASERPMTVADQALNGLVHDIRTPLGIALGYLRLVRANQLGTSDERDRALTQTMAALGGIVDLCRSAESFLPGAISGTTALVTTAVLADRVVTTVGKRARDVSWTTLDRDARVRVGIDVDALADAIALVLCGGVTVAPSGGGATVYVETRASELRFLAALPQQLPAFVGGVPTSFDPWHGHGLAVAAACHLIAHAGGRVWTTDGAIGARAVSLPLETSPV